MTRAQREWARAMAEAEANVIRTSRRWRVYAFRVWDYHSCRDAWAYGVCAA